MGTWLGVTLSVLASEPQLYALAQAEKQFSQDLWIEAAGVFWIAAELGILFAVTVGRRILARRPLPERLGLSAFERGLGLAMLGGLAALTLAVFGRHLFLTPLPERMVEIASGAPREIAGSVRVALVEHVRIHLAIWCAFITTWVGLEIAIVAQGVRAFNGLARLASNAAGGAGWPVAGWLLLGVGAGLLCGDAAGQEVARHLGPALARGYNEGLADVVAARRFVDFYLRVAGAVWVTVEWVAAVYLIRGYRMLRGVLREGPADVS